MIAYTQWYLLQRIPWHIFKRKKRNMFFFAKMLSVTTTYLDTRQKASAHIAGQGTNLMTTCWAAAWKWAWDTFSNTEDRVFTSADFAPGSPPTVSSMFPPWTTSTSRCVWHFFWWTRHKEKSQHSIIEKKICRIFNI